MSDADRWTPDQSVIDAARSRSTPLRDLSEMDRSVVIAALTLDGWTSARIADRLVCSLRTVQVYRARPATRAVRYALEVRRATLASLQDAIGVVSQDSHLFHDTMRANLLYARPEATDEQVWRALEGAHIAELVRALPEGLEEIVY